MLRIQYLVLAALLTAGPLRGQTSTPGTILATGTATVNAHPDQAQVTMGVVTQASTAQEAAQQNAAQTTAVIAALKATLGTNGTVQTICYSVTPRYSNTQRLRLSAILRPTRCRSPPSTWPGSGRLSTPPTRRAQQRERRQLQPAGSGPFVQQALGMAAKQALAHAAAIAADSARRQARWFRRRNGNRGAVRTDSPPRPAATSTPIAAGSVRFRPRSSDGATNSIEEYAKSETATLGGGCFWCLEAVYDEMEGVISVESGYMGGHAENPSYGRLHRHAPGTSRWCR